MCDFGLKLCKAGEEWGPDQAHDGQHKVRGPHEGGGGARDLSRLDREREREREIIYNSNNSDELIYPCCESPLEDTMVVVKSPKKRPAGEEDGPERKKTRDSVSLNF